MNFNINGFKITVRKCRKSDCDFVLKITRETLFPYLSKYRKPNIQKFKEDFYKTYKETQILIRKSRRIGLFQIEKHKDYLEIVKIILSPSYQGKGIGEFLMHYFETLGKKKIRLQVWDNNPAYQFYKRLGYKAIKKINHKVHMEKILRLPKARIIKFRAEDSVELAKMHRETIKHINIKDYPPEQIKIWASKTSAKYFLDTLKSFVRYVAVDDKKIIGFCDFKKGGGFGALYVHKDYQGKGVGKKLLTKIEKEAFKRGIREFEILSTITARNFYCQQGYKEIKKTTHKMDGHKVVVYQMKKKLKDLTNYN